MQLEAELCSYEYVYTYKVTYIEGINRKNVYSRIIGITNAIYKLISQH